MKIALIALTISSLAIPAIVSAQVVFPSIHKPKTAQTTPNTNNSVNNPTKTQKNTNSIQQPTFGTTRSLNTPSATRKTTVTTSIRQPRGGTSVTKKAAMPLRGTLQNNNRASDSNIDSFTELPVGRASQRNPTIAQQQFSNRLVGQIDRTQSPDITKEKLTGVLHAFKLSATAWDVANGKILTPLESYELIDEINENSMADLKSALTEMKRHKSELGVFNAFRNKLGDKKAIALLDDFRAGGPRLTSGYKRLGSQLKTLLNTIDERSERSEVIDALTTLKGMIDKNIPAKLLASSLAPFSSDGKFGEIDGRKIPSKSLVALASIAEDDEIDDLEVETSDGLSTLAAREAASM